jgi:hypothetical protein
MLINKATQSSYVALQQESVAALATQLNTIMTTQWDENDTNATRGEPVLRTVSGVLGQCIGTTDYPVGVTSSSGRYCKGKDGVYGYSASSTFGPDGFEAPYYDDIDDYDGNVSKISIYNNELIDTAIGDYIDLNITMTSNIFYGNDIPKKTDNTPSTGGYDQQIVFANPFRETNATTSSTNIKMISVVLTSVNPADELNSKQIRMSAFMCNIGAPKTLITNEDSL